MREEIVDALQARYDQLQGDTGFEEWRQLSHDILTALVDRQGLVIALQRRAVDQRTHRDERNTLRMRAEAAFFVVQCLHQLRRKVHALLAERRATIAIDRFVVHPVARAS